MGMQKQARNTIWIVLIAVLTAAAVLFSACTLDPPGVDGNGNTEADDDAEDAEDGEDGEDGEDDDSGPEIALVASPDTADAWFWHDDLGSEEIALTLSETDGDECAWTASIGQPWATLDTDSGTLTGSDQPLVLTVDATGLSSGIHETSVTFSVDGEEKASVTVSATVAEPNEHAIDDSLQWANMIAAADMDDDGDTDIVASGQGTYLYKNDGDGTFSDGSGVDGTNIEIHSQTPNRKGDRMRIADVDADGILDVVNDAPVGHASLLSQCDTLVWYKFDGDQSFTHNSVEYGTLVSGIDVGDIDGDGYLDVVGCRQGSSDTNRRWIYNLDNPTSADWDSDDVGGSGDEFHHYWLSDMDGDSDLDFLRIDPVVGSPAREIEWFENDGSIPPSFQIHTVLHTEDSLEDISVLDANEDGHTDIAAVIAGELYFYVNDGTADPSFNAPADPVAVGLPSVSMLETGDVNNDGHIDLLIASESDGTVAWCRSDGTADGSWPVRIVTSAFADASCVIASDLDGDGDTDLAGTSSSADIVVWWEL
jgi:hypothetical protein